MIRHLRKRESETLAEPAWLTEIEEPDSLAALEAGDRMPADPGPSTCCPRGRRTPTSTSLDQLMRPRARARRAPRSAQWMSED